MQLQATPLRSWSGWTYVRTVRLWSEQDDDGYDDKHMYE